MSEKTSNQFHVSPASCLQPASCDLRAGRLHIQKFIKLVFKKKNSSDHHPTYSCSLLLPLLDVISLSLPPPTVTEENLIWTKPEHTQR